MADEFEDYNEDFEEDGELGADEGNEMLTIKYSESPEIDEDDNVTMITSTTIIIERARVDQIGNIVNQFINDGEEVEVQIKHKFPKD